MKVRKKKTPPVHTGQETALAMPPYRSYAYTKYAVLDNGGICSVLPTAVNVQLALESPFIGDPAYRTLSIGGSL